MNNLGFERLKGRENYSTWKIGARAHLISKGFFETIEEALTEASTGVQKKADKKALAELTLLVHPDVYTYLEEANTAKDGWDALQSAFEDKGIVRKVTLLKQWIGLKLDDCKSMQEYVSKCLVLKSQVKSAGFAIDDEVSASIMLCGLNDQYKPMVLSVETKGDKLTVDYVKNLLLQEIDGESTGESALMAKRKEKFKKKFVVKCYNCGGPHLRKSCDKIDGRKDKKDKGETALYSAFSAIHNQSNDWYVDSAATAHMCRDNSSMKNKKEPTNKSVTVANQQSIKIESVGDIDQSVMIDGQIKSVTLKDVQYLPEICVNLLSVFQMVKKGLKVIFDKSGCKIIDKNSDIVATASLVGNMFKLNTVASDFACSAKDESAAMLWHRRLAHINFKTLNFVLKLKTDNIFCQTCNEGKMSRRPFKSSNTRATKLLELIHTDVCGPVTPSIGGAKYFVTFIDDFSKKVNIFAIKNKSDVFQKFVDYKNSVEKCLEKNIKIVRSDGGGEYIGKKFEQYLITHGIKHEKTAPYTPQQNGVAERYNRTIVEKVRCLLFDAKLNKKFWAEAAYAAVDVINMLPTSSNGDKTPNELWMGKPSDFDNMKVFGCKALVHVPQQKRKKLDKKAKEVIYLRHASDAKAYRFYDLKTGRIVISRDAVFVENETLTENDEDFSQILVNDECENHDVHNANDDSTRSIDSGEVSSDDEGSFHHDSFMNHENIATQNESTPNNSNEAIMISDESTIGNVSNETVIENTSNDTKYDSIMTSDDSGDETFTTRAKVNSDAQKPVTRSANAFNLMQSNYAFFSCEPRSYQEAVKSNEKENWFNAMKEEYDSLIKNETWTLVKPTKDQKVIDNKWVFKIKTNPDGSTNRYKARLVAKGFKQEHGVDYDETFSPVVRFTSIRMILAIAVVLNLKLRQFDVKTAFLYGELEENVFMKQPFGFNDNGNSVCKLQKSLYGLKQASRCWNKKFKHFIEKFGFVACASDPCVFVYKYMDNIVILAIYIDDGILAGNNNDFLDKVIEHLRQQFEIKVVDIGCFVGLQIDQRNDGSIFIHQNAYTKKILQRFRMDDCKIVSTPSDKNQTLEKFEKEKQANYPYRELIGSLLFLTATRPDISYSVGLISRYMERPTKIHVNAAKRVLKYLKGTQNFGILYQSGGPQRFTGYSDADYAGDIDTRKSTSGYAFILGNGIISWCSERQQSVSLSTTESEYVAASNAIKELIWLKRLINELVAGQYKSVEFYLDNQSAIRLIKNPEFHKRSKHIDVRYHFIREKFNEKLFNLHYVETKEQLADIFTKSLPRVAFQYLRSKLQIVPNIN